MATRILTVNTNASTRVNKVFLNSTGAPGNNVEVYSNTIDLSGCLIYPFDPNYLMVGRGKGILLSSDSGASWTDVMWGAGVSKGVRRLQSPVATTIFACEGSELFKSTDTGGSFSSVHDFTGTRVMDFDIPNGVVGYAVVVNETTGVPTLYSTNDSGATWTGVPHPFGPPPLAGETLRRVRVRSFDPAAVGPDHVLMLTSHRLLLVSNLRGSLTDPTVTVLWDFWGQALGLLPGATTGWNGSYDVISLFDEIEIDGTKTWLGGSHGLRAHSFGGPFFIDTAPPVVTYQPDGSYKCFRIRRFGLFGLSIGSGALGSNVSFNAGLWQSFDGGITILPDQQFDNKSYIESLDAYSDDDDIGDSLILGCTDDNACNHDPMAGGDSGGCQYVIKMIECGGLGEELHTINPDMFWRSCREPAFFFMVNSITPSQFTYVAKATVSGAPIFDFTTTLLDSTGPAMQAEFVAKLVFHINHNTGYRAVVVPPAYNPIQPGMTGCIMVIAPTTSYANLPVMTVSVNLSSSDSGSFDGGSLGSVVSIVERPGKCFRVCSPGNCELVAAYTFSQEFGTCEACSSQILPQPIVSCLDCSSQISVNGAPLTTSNSGCPQCVSLDSHMDIDLNVSFKDRQPEVLVPLQTGTNLPMAIPPVLTFTGDVSGMFIVGLSVLFNDGGSNRYVVASVLYDPITDATIVTFGGLYIPVGPIVDVTLYDRCPASVRIVIERSETLNGTLQFTQELDQIFWATNQLVQTSFDYSLPGYGNYRITLVASDCLETRTCEYWVRACGDLYVIETGCHTFKIGLLRPLTGTNAGDLFHVEVTDLSDMTTIVSDVPLLTTPGSIVGSKDTVYLVKVTGPDGVELSAQVIDLCDMLKCRASLTMSIFCEDPCKPEELTCADKDLRLEIGRMSLVTEEITRMVYNYRYAGLGIPNITEQRYADLTRLGQMIALARRIGSRCAECAEQREDCKPCGNS